LDPRVAVLLSTYNGEKYLAEQLDSLLKQSYKNLILVVRDDGSRDRTLDVIHSYLARFPDTFHRVEGDGQNLGACCSFSFLVQYVLEHKKELGLEKAYMMFCDQDDVWAENKVELEMRSMQKIEAGNMETPVLIYSDLKVVTDSRKLISESFICYQGLNIERNGFKYILLSNLVTGCTALINEPLAKQSIPIPSSAIMHDWWMALVASAFGRMVLINQPLVEYRQHTANTIGAIEYKRTPRSFKESMLRIVRTKPDPLLAELAHQAKAFLIRHRFQLGLANKIRLRVLSAMHIRSNFLQKVLIRLFYRL
jgi:glycosyltransferase involved in cell wall biosynthesis